MKFVVRLQKILLVLEITGLLKIGMTKDLPVVVLTPQFGVGVVGVDGHSVTS